MTMAEKHAMSDDSDGGGESRRKRTRQACLNCRREKVRCGGEKPICTFCHRLSQACVYPDDARNQHRDSMTDDDMSSLLMNAVTSRFTSLEDRLGKIEDSLKRFETIPLPGLTESQPQPLAMVLPTSHQSSAVFSTQTPFQPMPTADLTPPGTDPVVVTRFEHPPMHTLLFAADVFFRFCHNQPYSLFHEATFRRRLAAAELPQHQVWALLAMARRYSSLPDLQLSASDDAMFYARRAWECIDLPWGGTAGDEETIQIIQSIIIIVGIEHPAGHCISAYMKLGFAIRMALLARLHKEPDSSIPLPAREERRRVFWSLFLQDKLISLAKERVPIFREEDCTVCLPSTEAAYHDCVDEPGLVLSAFTGDCLETSATEACSPLALIYIMASVLSRVSQYVLHHDRYAQHGCPWSLTSPSAAIAATLVQLEMHFGLNDPPKETLEKRCFVNGAINQHLAGSFIYAKALFHLSHCLLHYPFLLQQRLQILGRKAPPSFMRTAWETCRKNAMNLTDLKDMRNYNMITLTSLYGYCTMVAGTIHVFAMNDDSATVREEGEKHYKAALDFLLELSCYWKHAALMANRLERFSKQTKGRAQPLAPGKQDTEALWQSVDYTLLSTPTRPGSPTQGQRASPSMVDFHFSPNQLFDYADLGFLGEPVDTCDGFSLGLQPEIQ